MKLLHKFNIYDKLQVCFFDTSFINTGNQKGVYIRLATELDKPIILACRDLFSVLL